MSERITDPTAAKHRFENKTHENRREGFMAKRESWPARWGSENLRLSSGKWGAAPSNEVSADDPRSANPLAAGNLLEGFI